MRLIAIGILLIALDLNAQAILDKSNLKTEINSVGKLFGSMGVEYPKNLSKYSFGESVMWLSGVNNTDTFISANYLGNNISDFQAGPLSENGQSGSMEAKWSNVYSISISEINQHIKDYLMEGYQVPESVKEWQANGDQGFTKLLAPFADWNNNNIYEPTQGDYPYIYGDQMAYTVFNDRGAHGLTGGIGMGVQVENLVSVYGIYGDEAMSNILINKVLISNKSSKDYSDYKLSILSHFILGDVDDNFVGTDAKSNFIYCYNSTGSDASYGNNIPGLVIFPLNMKDTILSTLYTTKDQNGHTGIPTNKMEFINYSQGLWRNGKAIAYGGSGLDGATPCKYIYSGTSDESINGSDWNELDVGNVGGNRSMLMNLNLDSLHAGEMKSVSIAYAVLDNYSGDVEDIKKLVKRVREFHLEGRYTSVSQIEKEFVIYPTYGVSGTQININLALNGHTVVNLYDSKGIRVQNIRNLDKKYIILKEGLVSGLYFLELLNSQGAYHTKLLIH